MRTGIILFMLALVLGVFNHSVLRKEQTISTGRSILLDLAPRDPRSLIQGDYMQLRYRIATQVSGNQLRDRGLLILSTDSNRVAEFVRLDAGEPLAPGELRLIYRLRDGVRLGPDSFMFQEGQANTYAAARYGELKVDAAGQAVLIGLRDSSFNLLTPVPSESTPE